MLKIKLANDECFEVAEDKTAELDSFFIDSTDDEEIKRVRELLTVGNLENIKLIRVSVGDDNTSEDVVQTEFNKMLWFVTTNYVDNFTCFSLMSIPTNVDIQEVMAKAAMFDEMMKEQEN